MARIFNSIRQRLLKENRFTRYLVYAVGEIILVVIGILIALYVNNSNAEKNLRVKELVLLKEMQRNLQADLSDVRYNVEGNRVRTRANERVLEALLNRTPLNDTLKVHFGNLFGDFQLSENSAAWENLKSVGIDLVSNDSLRNALAGLYSTRYAYLENLEKGLDDRYQWNNLYPQVLEHLNIEAIWNSATPVDHEALMDDREFREVLKMNIFIRHYMQQQYVMIEDEIRSILAQLDAHIRTLEGRP